MDKPDYNLDTKINNLFELYDEFDNIKIDFNYNNNKYYIYQKYSYLKNENSYIYNIFLNFGRLEKKVDIDSTNDTPLPNENRLIDVNTATNLNITTLGDQLKKKQILSKEKHYLEKTIGQYMGFYPNTYSSHVSQYVTVKYYQNPLIVDNTGTPYNILKFEFKNSETLFNKVYDLLTWAKSDMFIGFILENPLDNNNCKHAILKLEPKFCKNIITHHSDGFTSDGLEFRQFPEFAGETTFIELYITNKLHQFPKFNNEINPFDSDLNIFSKTIILPVVSDKPYELDNDNYMLMHLSTDKYKLDRLNSGKKSIQKIEEAFTQFRTEVDKHYFINPFNEISYKFNAAGTTINNFYVEFYDKYGNEYDLNNIDHSFVLELTHVDPQVSG